MRAFLAFTGLLFGALIVAALIAYPLYAGLHGVLDYPFHRYVRRLATLLIAVGLVLLLRRLRIANRQALGYGGALRVGFRECRKDLIFYTDGDAQYDPRELKLLLPAMTDDVDVVNGWKIERHDPFHRIIIGRLYHHFVKLMFGFKLRDVDCDFRLLRREVFDSIELESPDGTICLELVKKLQDAGFAFAEVPVHHYHRTYGKSQFFNFRRLSRVLPHVAWLWWKLVVRREHMKKLKMKRQKVKV